MSRFAAVAMYGFDEVHAHWEQLYAAAAAEVPGAPAALSWDHDIYETWTDPGLAIGQTCGWPLVTTLAQRVRVIGTFAHVAGVPGEPLYRSVLVARDQRSLVDLEREPVAVNGFDSLSGWISLRAALGHGRPAPEVIETGSHRASLHAVASGRAALASIDAVTWWFAQQLWPAEVGGLHVVGAGPLVPCLPLIVPARIDDAAIAQWRAALAHALEQEAQAAATLGITAFVPLDTADYQRLLAPLQVFAQP